MPLFGQSAIQSKSKSINQLDSPACLFRSKAACRIPTMATPLTRTTSRTQPASTITSALELKTTRCDLMRLCIKTQRQTILFWSATFKFASRAMEKTQISPIAQILLLQMPILRC